MEQAAVDEEDRRRSEMRDAIDVEAWREEPWDEDRVVICAKAAGFLQQIDLESLAALAREKEAQIVLHRAAGDFLVAGETIISARPVRNGDGLVAQRMRTC